MTDTKNTVSDERDGGWLIHKAGRGWYRPNAQGYTNDTAQAGRYSHADAHSYSHPNGWDGPRDGITIKHESELQFLRSGHPAVRVKGLEWSSEPPYSVARVFRGFYSTEWVEETRTCELRGIFAKGDFPTVAEAKAAAQADCERRILSALDLSPKEEIVR